MKNLAWPWRRLPENLPTRELAIIALLHMGLSSAVEMASVVFDSDRPTARQIRFTRSIVNIDRGPLWFLKTQGIPRGVSANVLRPVTCPTCNSRVTVVPCLQCFPGDYELIPRYPRREFSTKAAVRTAKRATKALPGSEAKLMEMRRRQERGESLFRDDDASFANREGFRHGRDSSERN